MANSRFKLILIDEHLKSFSKTDNRKLPTEKDVILAYFYQKEISCKKQPSFNELKYAVIQELVDLYNMVPQPMMDISSTETKLKTLLEQVYTISASSACTLRLMKSNFYRQRQHICPREPP